MSDSSGSRATVGGSQDGAQLTEFRHVPSLLKPRIQRLKQRARLVAPALRQQNLCECDRRVQFQHFRLLFPRELDRTEKARLGAGLVSLGEVNLAREAVQFRLVQVFLIFTGMPQPLGQAGEGSLADELPQHSIGRT